MKIEIIKNCPSCDTILVRVKDQLFCHNISCSGKAAKQVENYTKVLKIKGFGPKTIEKLEILSIQDLYNLNKKDLIDILGTTIGTKLFQEIEKAKVLNIGDFLAACSIPLIGKTAAKKVAMLTNNPLEINIKLCKEAGLGDKATKNLVDWIEKEYIQLILPIKFVEMQKTAQVNNKYTICITGRIKGYTKAKIADELSTFGVNIVDSVSTKIDYLVCEELKGSVKENKAKSLNKEIITLNKFKEILKNDKQNT